MSQPGMIGLREVEVVVLEEDDAAGGAGSRESSTIRCIRSLPPVLRVRLAGDDDLHRQREQPLESAKTSPARL